MTDAEIPQFTVSDEQYERLAPTMRVLASNGDVVRLARGLAMSEGFAVHLVGCETPLVAQALILCLATQVSELRRTPTKMARLAPTRTADAPLDPQGLGREVFDRLFFPDQAQRIICLDGTDSRADDRAAWIWLFQRLNERRNHLYAIKAPLLLLLPFDLSVELTHFAPDLWSIRGMGIRLLGERVGERRGIEMPGMAATIDLPAKGIADTNIERLEANVASFLGEAGPHAKRALMVEAQRLAEVWGEQGQKGRALDLLQRRVMPVIRASSGRLQAELLFEMVETLVRLGSAEEAERLAREEAFPQLERTGNRLAIANLLSRLGDAHRLQGENVRALQILVNEALPQ
jgi:hypothetical protein